MIKTLFLSLLATVILADNPRAYSAIGDPIYNNADKILDLKHIKEFQPFEVRIDNYYFDVDEVKDRGFELDKSKKDIGSKEYLFRLRTLIKTNDYFIKRVNSSFKSSISNNNFELFSNIINSGLLNTKKYKKEILNYYFKHSKEINAKGVIQDFLDEDERARVKREAWLKSIPTKEQIQNAKIKRIREKDRAKKEAREKELQEVLKRKKIDIRKEQKKELSPY